MKSNRIEKHIIKKTHPMWKELDNLCLKSKNLYNYANYIQRQLFTKGEPIMKYYDLTFELKHSEPFKELGSNSAQHTLKILCKDWKSFFVSIKDYSKNPSKYLGRPNLPKYKDKNGRYICVLTNMQSQIKDGYLYFAFKPLKPFNNTIRTNIKGKHMQTRIIPKGSCYVLEIVHEIDIPDLKEQNNRIVGIDLGVNNFVTMANNIGVKSIIINGRGVKSYNRYWNKEMAKYKSLAITNNGMDWTSRLSSLTLKRNNKMEYFLHKTTKEIVNYCLSHNIDTVVVGINKEWKQKVNNMKKVSRQTFVQIPYDSFINKLRYKCEDYGINFIITEERYTSGTSFLDNELPIKENYNKKRRIKRGLFKSNDGTLINSDLNGAYQIIKKVFPNAFADGIVDADLHPLMINLI